jgi:hypothetical protein
LLFKNANIKIYKIVILPFVLYVKLHFYTQRKNTLRVFDNRVLRRIFGPMRDDVRGWRELHNEELE